MFAWAAAMKVGNIYVANSALYLPEEISSLEKAAAQGVVPDDLVATSPYLQVHVADDEAWRMGIRAASEVLNGMGIEARRIDYLAYAGVSIVEEEPYSPAHRMARLLGATDAVAVNLKQMSNAGSEAVRQSLLHLAVEQDTEVCVAVASSDHRGLPYPRWSSLPGVVLGDGAAALLLTRRPGKLEILSIAVGGDVSTENKFPARHPYRPTEGNRRPDFSTGPYVVAAMRRLTRRVVGRALADAAIKPDDSAVTRFLPPRMGMLFHRVHFQPGIEIDRDRVRILGGETGHLGAGDLIANIHELLADDTFMPGEIAIALSLGAGMTASCAVLRRP
ncbi:ketoacyl-ACP synthase III family protein [Kitasatospora sp. NPDC006697]|uniref:ketoacyl-ACP synthase III family protein n=1 Tax=Kitasatospora sp. NPDC006697 TaxID=3364020 RepID=UPI00367FDB17